MCIIFLHPACRAMLHGSSSHQHQKKLSLIQSRRNTPLRPNWGNGLLRLIPVYAETGLTGRPDSTETALLPPSWDSVGRKGQGVPAFPSRVRLPVAGSTTSHSNRRQDDVPAS